MVYLRKINKYIHRDIVKSDCTKITFIWNPQVDNYTRNEFKLMLGDGKKNMRWVSLWKEQFNWKRGTFLYGFIENSPNGVTIHTVRDRQEECDLILEPNGYVCMRTINLYSAQESEFIKSILYIRVDSIYNDKISVLNRFLQETKVF
jgi:hypothetical protein